MNVSDTTKSAYMRPSHKNLQIYFPEIDLHVESSQTYEESMRLTERLVDGKNFEIVGCISSVFEIQMNGIVQDVKGRQIDVTLKADDTEEIPLFRGVVDSAKKQSNKNFKKIIAYDELYTKGNIDLADWYNGLPFPIKQKDFRDSLFAYIGLEQVECELPNDGMIINKEYAPTQLRAISVIKSICQINGAFGIINRYGKFEYRILASSIKKNGAFPGLTLYPGSTTYPGCVYGDGEQKIEVRDVAFYRKVDYEEYSIKPVEKVTIRQTDNDVGASYGEGSNNYIIQGNMFTLNKRAEELQMIAQNVYNSIAGVEFVPFSAENSGYPFIEVGLDGVSYYTHNYEASARARSKDIYTQKTFYIFKRTLSGIQALKDVYSVQGKEYQSEFITDVGTQIEQIKQNLTAEVSNQIQTVLPQYTYSKDEINNILSNMFKVESVKSIPANTDKNTIYLIQGEVVVE